MPFISRIEELCCERNISKRKMETEAGIAIGSVSKWKKGFKPNQSSLNKLSNYFGVSISYLTGESKFRNKNDMYQAWKSEFDTEELANEVKEIEKDHVFILRVETNDMSPRILVDDTLIVKRQNKARTGDLVVVKVNGRVVCRKYYEDDFTCVLEAYNKNIPPIVSQTVEIVGKVMRIIGNC